MRTLHAMALRLRSSLLACLAVAACGFSPPNDDFWTDPPYLSWTEDKQPPMIILDDDEHPSNTENANAQSSPIPWQNYKPFGGFIEIWNGVPKGFELAPSPFPSPSPEPRLFKIPDIYKIADDYYESYYDYNY